MSTIVLVIHLMVAVALITVVLLQRSEGGALGIGGGGGGGGGGGFMTGRGTANMLTRLTTILAGVFFITSITLTILAGQPGTGSVGDGGLLQQIERSGGGSGSGSSGGDSSSGSGGNLLDKIETPSAPTAPASQ